jgi:hypothetical protein
MLQTTVPIYSPEVQLYTAIVEKVHPIQGPEVHYYTAIVAGSSYTWSRKTLLYSYCRGS